MEFSTNYVKIKKSKLSHFYCAYHKSKDEKIET